MKRLIRIVAALGLLLGANSAFAQYVDGTEDNTDAGTVVTNEATVSYEVNGVAQVAESDDVTFVVDRAVMLTVASNGGANVTPGASDQALAFTVTNDTNAAIDILLAPSNGGGDDFNADNVTLWLEDGTSAGFQDDEDTLIAGNRLVAMAEEADEIVYIVGDIPDSTSVGDGDTADMVLLATAYELAANGGGIITETNTGVADDPNVEDTVFGDADGDTDALEDGAHSDTGTFTVATATISVTKSSVVIEDPFNGTTNPKAIPGAEVLYCIEVTNAGGSIAENVSIKDPVPANTTYVNESIEVFTADITCAAALVGTGAAITDDDADTENAAYSGNSGDTAAVPTPETTDTVVNTTVDALPATTGVTATIFRVIVD